MNFAKNHIAEICAALVPYGLLIKVDYLLDHHTTIILQDELERALWHFFNTLQRSDALTGNAYRNRGK